MMYRDNNKSLQMPSGSAPPVPKQLKAGRQKKKELEKKRKTGKTGKTGKTINNLVPACSDK